MPMWAMRCVARPIASTPLTLIEPLRAPTSPRMDFRVVVRPAPLRPRSVTTSPSFTVRSTPCRMCDSPYQALRPAMDRAGVAPAPMSVHRSHVGLDDAGILRDFRVGSLGEDGAPLQDRNRVADTRYDAHVVLDHQD